MWEEMFFKAFKPSQYKIVKRKGVFRVQAKIMDFWKWAKQPVPPEGDLQIINFVSEEEARDWICEQIKEMSESWETVDTIKVS